MLRLIAIAEDEVNLTTQTKITPLDHLVLLYWRI